MYGELATAASSIQLAQEPAIKTPDQYTLMGKPLARLDTPLKVNGSAIFGADVRLPDMLFATSKTSPIVGATVKSYDFNAIRNRPGVHSGVEFQASTECTPTGACRKEGSTSAWPPTAAAPFDVPVNTCSRRAQAPGSD